MMLAYNHSHSSCVVGVAALVYLVGLTAYQRDAGIAEVYGKAIHQYLIDGHRSRDAEEKITQRSVYRDDVLASGGKTCLCLMDGIVGT